MHPINKKKKKTHPLYFKIILAFMNRLGSMKYFSSVRAISRW